MSNVTLTRKTLKNNNLRIILQSDIAEEKPLGGIGHGWHTHILHHSSPIYKPLKCDKASIMLIIKALTSFE